MESDIFYEYPNDQYNRGIVLEEYNGELNLVAGIKTDQGNVFKRWVFPQRKDKTPTDKAIPMKIRLGNTVEAVRALRFLLGQLEMDNGDDGPPF